jgi:membrane-bound metal-dependent hydrolase YbcI (DUF457 family)
MPAEGMLEQLVEAGLQTVSHAPALLDTAVAYSGDLWHRLQGVWEYFKSDPAYVSLAPIRHYIGGLLFRDAAAKIYQKITGTKTDAVSNPLAIASLALLPDADVLLGIEHRAQTHSLAFAAAAGTATAGCAAAAKKPLGTYLFIPAAVVASHLFVDMVVEGGTAINPFWPVPVERTSIHNSDAIGHGFTAAGIAYMWFRYHWTDKLGKAAAYIKGLFKK